MEALPEEMDQMKPMFDAAKNFDVNALDEFMAWLKKGECTTTNVKELREAGDWLKEQIVGTISKNDELEKLGVWKVLKNKIKTETVEFANHHDPIEKQLTSTMDFLGEIVNQFNESEGIFRDKMIELTYDKNHQTKKFYILPSVIVGLFSSFSIYTILNPQLCSSQLGRITISGLFYVVSLQVIVLVIYEFNSDSVCHLNPKQFQLYKFEIPLYNKPSIAITKDVFSKCVSTKSHIFSVSNNGMFIPKSSFLNYFENMRSRFIHDTHSFIFYIRDLERGFKNLKRIFDEAADKLIKMCVQVKIYQDTFKNISNSWNGYYEHGLTVNNIDKENISDIEIIANRNLEKLYVVIFNPIQKYNHIINSTFLDCDSMFKSYKHGYDRSCFIINEEVIDMLKMVVIGCSVLCSVIHLLNLRRLDINIKYQGYQPLPTV